MSRFRFARISLPVVIGLCIVLLISACGGSAKQSGSGVAAKQSGSGLEKTHIVVGALPLVDTAGLYLAIQRGYFKQVGLNVTVKPVAQSTSAIPDMLHGTIDIIAGANYVSFFQAEAKGALKFSILVDATACKPQSFGVLALPASGITTPADLAGKTVAVNLTNNVQTLTLNAILKSDGVNPSSVHYVEIPFPDLVTALTAHRVQAISAVEPFLTGAELSGAKLVVSQCTGPTGGFPLSGYFATESWAQQNPKTARAFQTAMEKGQALADNDPQAVRKILPTYTKISGQVASRITLNTYPSSLNAAHLQRAATLMLSGGLLSSPLNVSSLLFH